MNFLERLKNKPSYVKTQYAFTGAILVTGVIALMWTTTLPARFGAITASIDTAEVGTDVASAQAGLGAILKQGLKTEDEFTRTDEAPSTEINPYDDIASPGALGDLSGWGELTASSTYEKTLDPSLPIVTLPPQSSEQSAIDTRAPQAPVPSGTTTSPKSTVILIGTTTKKAE